MSFFPSTVPTTNELLDAKNNTKTDLDGAINNSVTTIQVDDTSNFPTAGRATLDDGTFEIISYTSKNATQFLGVTRGVDGSAAAAHADAADIAIFQSAKYHNVVAEEIIAIAQNLSDRIGLDATNLVIPSGGRILMNGATDGTIGIFVSSPGAVTADPGADLIVLESNGNFGISMLGGGTSVMRMQFGKTTGNEIAFWEVDNTTNFMKWATGGGIVGMTLNSIQRLGIGTETPLGKLHVVTASSGATADTDGDELILENSGNTGLSILSGNTGFGAIFFGDDGDGNIGFISYNHNNNSLSFATNAVVAMTLNSNQQTLHSDGTGALPSVSFINDSGTGFFSGGSGDISFVSNTVATVKIVPGIFRPSADNLISLGILTRRWTEVFAVAGSINTSHSSEKGDIRDIPNVVIPRGKIFKRLQKDGSLSARDYIGYINDDLPQECRSWDAMTGIFGTTDNYENAVTGMLCEGYWSHDDKIKSLEKEIKTLKEAA